MPDTWRQLQTPSICERMLAFSVPQDDTVLIISYEGTHLIKLPPTETVETDPAFTEYDIYDPRTGVCHYRGKSWEMIGLSPGRPLLDGRGGERLVVDKFALTVSVAVNGAAVWSSPFENFSGDWVAATFSPDGRFIVLGCPYDFDFCVWERVH